jgi:hypothetical protein
MHISEDVASLLSESIIGIRWTFLYVLKRNNQKKMSMVTRIDGFWIISNGMGVFGDSGELQHG